MPIGVQRRLCKAGVRGSIRLSSTTGSNFALTRGFARLVSGRVFSAGVNVVRAGLRVADRVHRPQLLQIPGYPGLTAAQIIAETAGVSRFRSAAAFAIHTGTAPIPVWTGNRTRFRLNRGGNRQLNADLHSPATDPSTRLSPDPTKDQPTRTSRHSVRDVVIHTETEGPHPYQDHLKCRMQAGEHLVGDAGSVSGGERGAHCA